MEQGNDYYIPNDLGYLLFQSNNLCTIPKPAVICFCVCNAALAPTVNDELCFSGTLICAHPYRSFGLLRRIVQYKRHVRHKRRFLLCSRSLQKIVITADGGC
jgi:hypothetical protein